MALDLAGNFFGVKIVNAVTCKGKVDIFGNAGTKIGHSELTTKRTKGTKKEVRGIGEAAWR